MANLKEALKRLLLNGAQTPLLPLGKRHAGKRTLFQMPLLHQPGAKRMSRARIRRDRALDPKGSSNQRLCPQKSQPSSDLTAGERGEQKKLAPRRIPLQLTQRGFMPFSRLRLPVSGVLPVLATWDICSEKRTECIRLNEFPCRNW
jgi:hypothetical protein